MTKEFLTEAKASTGPHAEEVFVCVFPPRWRGPRATWGRWGNKGRHIAHTSQQVPSPPQSQRFASRLKRRRQRISSGSSSRCNACAREGQRERRGHGRLAGTAMPRCPRKSWNGIARGVLLRVGRLQRSGQPLARIRPHGNVGRWRRRPLAATLAQELGPTGARHRPLTPTLRTWGSTAIGGERRQ